MTTIAEQLLGGNSSARSHMSVASNSSFGSRGSGLDTSRQPKKRRAEPVPGIKKEHSGSSGTDDYNKLVGQCVASLLARMRAAEGSLYNCVMISAVAAGGLFAGYPPLLLHT